MNEAMVAMLAALWFPSVRGGSNLGLLAEKAALVMPMVDVDLDGSDVKDDTTRS